MFNIGDIVTPKHEVHRKTFGIMGKVIGIRNEASYKIFFMKHGITEHFSPNNLKLLTKKKPKIKSRPWK